MIIFKLFTEFLKIGAFSFGGGLGTLPYIYEMARKTSWITEDYITNILTVSQITPGPLACNIATLVGLKTYGLIGAVIANLGFITPAICFMGVGYKLINKVKNNNTANKIIKTVRSAALAVVISSSLTLFKTAFLLTDDFVNTDISNMLSIINFKSIILGIAIYFFSKNKKINSICIMLFSAILAVMIKI